MTEGKLSSIDLTLHFKNKELRYDNVAGGREVAWMAFSKAYAARYVYPGYQAHTSISGTSKEFKEVHKISKALCLQYSHSKSYRLLI